MSGLTVERYLAPAPPFTNNRRKKTAFHLALVRDLFKCARCGSRDELTMHHRKPQANGGKHIVDNLETLCVDCHKAEHHPEAA